MKYGGALPKQLLLELIPGFLDNVQEGNIRPSSVDLTATDEFYRVQGTFLPGHDETVFESLNRIGKKRVLEGSVLEPGTSYVCKLAEEVRELPEEVYGYANPKSSSGRVDVHVRLLTDGVSRYDTIPERYKGPLWMLVVPKTFPLIIMSGVSLNQVRFFTQDTRLDHYRLQTAFEKDGGLLCRPNGEMIKFSEIRHSDRDGSLILTLGLSDFEYPGYEAVPSREPIDLSKVDHYDPEYFFRPIRVSHKSVALGATFYILSTKEYVRVPAKLACEMAPMDERSGDFRSHYAGYIDPGWGIGEDGRGKGQPLTLEVRSFDNGIIIQDGQPIAKVRYERMIESPDEHYGQMLSNYGQQSGPQFSKHFKKWTR